MASIRSHPFLTTPPVSAFDSQNFMAQRMETNEPIEPVKRIDARIVHWMGEHGLTVLRLSLGIVFLWFGILKFFPGISVAETLATRTISVLTFGSVPPHISSPLLAAWETAIGLGLLTGRLMRITLGLLFLQMVGTFLPLVFFPEETWKIPLLVPSLEGQYIIKNLVLIASGLVLGATVRGGKLIADPNAVRTAERMQSGRWFWPERFGRKTSRNRI